MTYTPHQAYGIFRQCYRVGLMILFWVVVSLSQLLAAPAIEADRASMVPGSRVTCRVTGAPSGSVVKWKIGGGARIVSTDEWKREAVVEILKPGEVVLSAAVGGQTLQIKLGQAGAGAIDLGSPKGVPDAGVNKSEVSKEAVPAPMPAEDAAVLVSQDPSAYTSGVSVTRGVPPTTDVKAQPEVAVSRDGAEGGVRGSAKPGRIHFEVPDYTAVAVTLPPVMDLSDLDTAQWAGAVSAAREAMRMVFGEMTPEETEKFEAKWRPLLAFPCKEVVSYMNKLNPLLAQFLAFRRAAAEAGLALDRVQFEAAHLAAYGDMEGFAGAMQGMASLRAQIHGIGQAMERVVQAIVALGDPPDAVEEQKKARKRHGDAFAMFSGGRGLEGEWVGRMTEQSFEKDKCIYTFESEEFLQKRIREGDKKKTIEERAASVKGEVARQEAWDSGKPILPAMANNFSQHFIISKVPTREGEDRWHSYNFYGEDINRESYEKGNRLPFFENDRAACVRWMNCPNFLWPELEEGTNFWTLEHTSRNPSGWNTKWVWEFDLEGNTLKITERGTYEDVRSKYYVRLEGDNQRHRIRTWELRRVARSAVKARPADWSVEKAVQPVEVPVSAWVLKEVKAKPNIVPCEDYTKELVDIAKDALSGSITRIRAYTSPTSELICTYTYKTHPAMPDKLFPGDTFSMTGEVSVAVSANGIDIGVLKSEILQKDLHGILLLHDTFTEEGGESILIAPNIYAQGTSVKSDAKLNADLRPASKSFHYKSGPIMVMPYEKGATRVVIVNAGTPYCAQGSYEVRFVYESVPIEKVDETSGKPLITGTGKKGMLPKKPEDEGKADQIKFHENNIKYFGKCVEETEARLRGEKDPAAAVQLHRDLLYQKDALQREQDQIATIRTGEFVHTRTAADEFNQRLMAEEGRRMAEKFHTLHRIIERMPRLIASAPPEDQQKLRDFYNRHVNSATIASGDIEGIKKAAGAIGDTIGGIRQREQAAAEEDLAWEEYKTASAETVKGAADFSLMALSSAAGPPGWGIFAGYSALTTGYMDGNPVGALKQTLTGVSAAGAVADQIFTAYENGVVKAYEDYAKDPTKGPVNEVEAGLSAAGWEGAKTVAIMGAMRLGLHFLMGPAPMTVEEFTKQRSFLQAQGVGRERLKLFEEASEQCLAVHNRLRDSGIKLNELANHPELRAAQQKMCEAYGKVKVDYHAKMLMNQSGNNALLSSYNKTDTTQMRKVQCRLRELMEADGYNPQQYKLFSNSASSKKVAAGMDVDLGVDESAPEFLKGIFQTKDGVTRKVAMHEYREAGQKKLKQAFRDVMGEEWEEPFLLFTNSQHKEAYKQGRHYWLGNAQVPHAVVENIAKDGKGWTQQAASVTRVKVDDMSRALGLDDYTKLQEQCRGLAKDFNTKLAPLMPKATNKQAVAHMQELYDVMDQFAKNEIGPVEADRKLRILSGGRGMEEIADQFRTMLEGLAGGMAK